MLGFINQFSTPYYLYTESMVRSQIQSILESNIDSHNIHYSLMANNNLKVLRIIKDLGVGVFTSTISELLLALKADFIKIKLSFVPRILVMRK